MRAYICFVVSLVSFLTNTTISSAQILPQVDFGTLPLGSSIDRSATVGLPQFPGIYQLVKADAIFLRITNPPVGPFHYRGETIPVDITSTAKDFPIRFIPIDTGSVTYQIVFERVLQLTYRGVPFAFRDTIVYDLTGRGIALNIPPTTINIPPSTFTFLPINNIGQTANLDATLGRTFGPYSETEWRLFSYIPQFERYVEYSGTSGNKRNPSAFFVNFLRANVYFLISRAEKTLRLPGYLLTSLSDGNLSLESGWNLVTSPYPYQVDWDYTMNVLKLQGLVTRARALTNEGFEASGNSQFINPTQGFFILSRTTLPNLVVHPHIATQFAKPSNRSTSTWTLRIESAFGNSHWVNHIGMDEDARDDFDSYDFPMPPLLPERSVALLRQPLDRDYPFYVDDLRAINSSGSVWELELQRKNNERTCTVRFIPSENYPDEFMMFVLDEREKNLHNVTDEKSFVTHFVDGEKSRVLKLFVGTKAYIENQVRGYSLEVTDYFLDQLYPNPFSHTQYSQLSARFGLPRDGFVCLKIYDHLGRIIGAPTEQFMKAGMHDWKFNLSDVHPGVFFLRMDIDGGWNAVKKFMVIE